MGTCFGMLIYLVLTMVILWTLFSSLNSISYYKISTQFLSVRDAYYTTYGIDMTHDGEEIEYTEPAAEGEKRPKYTLAYDDYLKLSEEEKSAKLEEANANALAKYNENKESFLWIENIWIADSTANPVMSYSDFISTSSLTAEQISEEEYNLIMNPIKGTVRKNNGCFILVLLAAGINYLSMVMPGWISKAKAKKQGIDPVLMGANNKSNKLMQFIMPVIMGIFTLFYNAAFGLYIVAGALIGLITSPLITIFVDMLEVESIKKEQDRRTAIYDRKRK
jgi:membrane protein insertase Oxa1/YidC/SpoIIIJ